MNIDIWCANSCFNDPAQRSALRELERIHHALERPNVPRPGLGRRLRALWRQPPPVPPLGLYLWGGVGRGKTLLLDLFVEALPAGVALRLHFHHFMREVHAQMRELGIRPDPLPLVADGIAARTRVLCLDEFLVNDIGDAMILAGLLDALFARGVALVTTSNTPPQELYRDGLQRARFLPAIALLERHCRVWELASEHDWRLRGLRQRPVYQTPAGPQADAALAAIFEAQAQGEVVEGGDLLINGREVETRRRAERVVWFDFQPLCVGPRAASDYIELANRYHTVLISDVPRLDAGQDASAKRFVHMVDEFYDRNVKLALSAETSLDGLYAGTRLRAEFGRTVSRLMEMQSEEYLGREHRF
ncbi:MAG: cell division protein ZapE [Acidihalobacter sp.]